MYSDIWWPFRLIRRLQNAIEIIMIPLRMVSLMIDIVVGGSFVGLLVLGWCIYDHVIPESEVAGFVANVGSQALAVLKLQGVF